MSFRRSSIDKINNKYRASFAGKERIGNVAPSVFVGNVGQQALKRSFVQNIQEPQIVEKIQTRVPIEVNPRVVNENKITKVTTPPPTIIPRKARGARGHFEDLSRSKGCCSSCPWWLIILLGLLLLLGLVTGLLFAFKDKLGLFKQASKDETKVTTFNVNNENKQSGNETKPQQNKQKTSLLNETNPVINDSNNKQETNQNTNTQNQANEEANKNKEEKQNKQNNQTSSSTPPTQQQQDDTNTTDNGDNLELQSGANVNLGIQVNKNQKNTITVTNVTCKSGYFFNKGKCLSCPEESLWDGNNCIKKVKVPSSPKPIKNTTVQKITSTTQNNNTTKTTSAVNNVSEIQVKDPWSIVKANDADVSAFQQKLAEDSFKAQINSGNIVQPKTSQTTSELSSDKTIKTQVNTKVTESSKQIPTQTSSSHLRRIVH